MNLWNLTLMFRAQPVNLVMNFKSESTARTQWLLLTAAKEPFEKLVLADDFNSEVVCIPNDLLSIMLSEVHGAHEAAAEMQLAAAHANASLQRKAAADPILNSKLVAAPALVHPMSNGRGN